MPCRDDYGPRYVEDPETRRRLDRATQVACEALHAIETMAGEGRVAALSEVTNYWWKQHKAADKAREDREQAMRDRETLRSRAKAKLTPEERKVLGL